MKKLFISAAALLILGTVQMTGQQVGNQAPDFEVGLLGGETFKLSEQEGKVVFVFLFGNGCPSCVAAGGNVETSIYQSFKDNANFRAIGLDTWDLSSNEATVTSFKNTTGISFPLGLMAGAIAASYQTTYDRFLVIDPQGVLVHKGIVVARNDIDNAVLAINQNLTVTGIDEELDAPQLLVYPNPVSDVLHISTGGESASGIELYDVAGKRVLYSDLSIKPESSSVDISIRHLEAGVYFYSILTEGLPLSGKLLIQR